MADYLNNFGLGDDDLNLRDLGEPGSKRQTVDISLYSVQELLDLRDAIDSKLPAKSLKDINLAEELVLQFTRVRELQASTLLDEKVEPNKKAAVVNATNSALQQLVKLQTDLHTAERFKAIENLVVSHMRKLPLATAEAFLREYEGIEQ